MKLIVLILLMLIYFFPSQALKTSMINIISFSWLIGFLIYSLYIYYFHDKEYKIKLSDRGNGDVPAKRTPVELNYLVNGNINAKCVTSTLMDLIRRQVLIVEKKGKNYIINYNEERGRNLLRSEQFMVHWLMKRMGYKNQVSLDGIIREYKANRNFFYLSYKEWTSRAVIEGLKESFFEKTESVSRNAYSFIAIAVVLIILNLLLENNILLITTMITSVVIFGIYIYSYTKRTYEANKEYVKWETFKSNLNNYAKYKEKNNIEYLEDCAIYANLLNKLAIYKKILKQKSHNNPEVLEGSILLKMIINNDIPKINKRIEKCIKWSVIIETMFNS